MDCIYSGRPAAHGGSLARAARKGTAACGHGPGCEVTTPEGEVVCRACGAVKGEDEQSRYGGPAAPTPSRTNLYLEMEVGGKPDRRLRADRFVRRRSDMAAVSNISQKLGIPNGAGRDVWARYQKMRRAPGMRMTKAKLLVLAFYGVCRLWGCPLNEARLLDAIRMELGVKHTHSYLRVIMEASSRLDGGSEGHMLHRMGFPGMPGGAPVATGACGGGSSNSGNSSRGNCTGPDTAPAPAPPQSCMFPMSTEIQSLAYEYEPEMAEAIAREARSILPVLVQTESNRARAARVAIRIAKRRYGAR
ncbi:MAG: hypothetical protein OXI27_06040 [Thaumarchaeota archaeon]|nr:hypothetical protein [Nitrososphaerota archaeon]